MARPKVPLRERFFRYVIIQEGCWGWKKSVDKDGYAWIYDEEFRHRRAHHISWELHFGPVPAGHLVRHKCDTPRCTNPEHLDIGTQQQNIQDMDSRGRRGTGSRKHRPEVQRSLVKSARQGGESVAAIAARLDIPKTTVRRWAKEEMSDGSR